MAVTSPEAVSQTSVEPDVVQLPVVEQLREARRIRNIMEAIHGELAFRQLKGVTVKRRDNTILVISDIPGLCDAMLDMQRSQNALFAHAAIKQICQSARMQCRFLHPIHVQWMNEERATSAAVEAEVTLPQPLLQPEAVLRPA